MKTILWVLLVITGMPMVVMVGYLAVFGHDPKKVGGAQVVPTFILIFLFLLLIIIGQATDAFRGFPT